MFLRVLLLEETQGGSNSERLYGLRLELWQIQLAADIHIYTMASPCDSESYMPLAKRRRRSNSFEDAPDLVKGDILVDSNRPRKPRRNFDRHMVFNVLPGPKVNASLPPRVDSMAAEPVVTLDAAQERCSDWWLDTGDLVLGVENLMLKVHKRVLAEHSIIFGDMFDISQPELSNDGAENLPFVQLQDTAADWIETLKWLYTGTFVSFLENL